MNALAAEAGTILALGIIGAQIALVVGLGVIAGAAAVGIENLLDRILFHRD